MSFRRREFQGEAPLRRRFRGSGAFAPLPVAALVGTALSLVGISNGWGDTVLLENGVIWTGDPSRPWAEAIALDGDRILAVGTRAEVDALASSTKVRVDLGGAFLCPGIVDAHTHVIGLGRKLGRVDLTGALTLEECLERVRKGVETRREQGESGWVQGRGWDQNDWPVTAFPTRHDLDAVAPDHAVILTRIDGHALWVNSRALALAGIDRDTPDPDGGKIHRDARGEPTGILIDNAMDLVQRVVPAPSRDEDRSAIHRATELLVQAGITGVHDMGMSAGQADLYRELAQRGELGVRIYGALYVSDPGLESVLARGADREWTGGMFRLGMVKFFMDGALGSRGAALLAPYSDDPGNLGLLLCNPDSLRGDLERSLEAGFQCAVHAIGDRGNRLLLDTWAALRADRTDLAQGLPVPPAALCSLGELPAARASVRLEHAQVLHPDDIARLGSLGILASMQPTHCTSDMPWAPERLGPDRLAGAYAWRSVVDAGAVLVAGSDVPVESHDPRMGLYAAITRRMTNGQPAQGWSPGERLARGEALAAFTAAPAYASGDLHALGTLTPGKLADFVVFDRNLVTCDPELILDAEVEWTVIGGRSRWMNAAWPPSRSVQQAFRERAR